MKKFIVPVFALLFAVMAFQFAEVSDVYAQAGGNQLISNDDNPENVSGATGGTGSFRLLAKRIVDFFLLFLGLVAVIMIIYGGFLYVTSAGNDQNVEKGKKILIYAAIGIIVILISFALVNTLLGAGEAGAGRASLNGAFLPSLLPIA